ncbi:GNAT family N-acetyltransferase [Actinoplanes sp. URMC 104]|uniref:GNAT family N-acetyltransferase n=1 Tax=Actinoplanes sp. URMC 104 TaxID=3423409 RepID=UPI003F19F792
MGRLPRVGLVPFDEGLLPAVQVWFEDAEVQRWLGGPDWPAREFRIRGHGIGEEFRGMRVLRVHSWVALDEEGVPVGHVGGDVYDRWAEDGKSEPGPSMGMAYVVDPRRRRQGYGTATLRAAVGAPEVAEVRVFALGIEPENTASVRCAVAAGFRADDPQPNGEGVVYHLLRRNAGDLAGGLG